MGKVKKNVSKNIIAPNLDEEVKILFTNGNFAKINKLRAYWDYTDINIPVNSKASFLLRVYCGDKLVYQNVVYENEFTQLKNYVKSLGVKQVSKTRSSFNNNRTVEKVIPPKEPIKKVKFENQVKDVWKDKIDYPPHQKELENFDNERATEAVKEKKRPTLPKPTESEAVGFYVGENILMICKLVGGKDYSAVKITRDSRDRYIVRLKGGGAVITMADNPKILLQALKGFGVQQNLENVTKVVHIPCPINKSISSKKSLPASDRVISQDTRDMVELAGYLGKDTSKVLRGIDTVNDGTQVIQSGRAAYDEVKAGNYGYLAGQESQDTIKLVGNLTGKDTSKVLNGVQTINDGVDVVEGGKRAYGEIKSKNYRYLVSDDMRNTARKGSTLVSGFIKDGEKRSKFENGVGKGFQVMGATDGTFKAADKIKNKDYQGLTDAETRNTVDSVGRLAGYDTSGITTNMKTAESGIELAKGIKNGEVVEVLKSQEIGYSQPGGAKLTGKLTEDGKGVQGSFDTGLVDTGFYGVTAGVDGDYEAKVDRDAGEVSVKVDGNAKIGYSQVELANVKGKVEVKLSKHEDARVNASLDKIQIGRTITVADKDNDTLLGEMTGADDVLKTGNSVLGAMVNTHDENGEKVVGYDRIQKLREARSKVATTPLRVASKANSFSRMAIMRKHVEGGKLDEYIGECDERIENSTDFERGYWVKQRRKAIDKARNIRKPGIVERALDDHERVGAADGAAGRRIEKKLIKAERDFEGIEYKFKAAEEDGRSVGWFDEYRYNKKLERLDRINAQKEARVNIRREKFRCWRG